MASSQSIQVMVGGDVAQSIDVWIPCSCEAKQVSARRMDPRTLEPGQKQKVESGTACFPLRYDFQDSDDPEANVVVAFLYGLLPVTMLVIGGSCMSRGVKPGCFAACVP